MWSNSTAEMMSAVWVASMEGKGIMQQNLAQFCTTRFLLRIHVAHCLRLELTGFVACRRILLPCNACVQVLACAKPQPSDGLSQEHAILAILYLLSSGALAEAL